MLNTHNILLELNIDHIHKFLFNVILKIEIDLNIIISIFDANLF